MAKLFKYYNDDLEKVWYQSSNIKYSEIDDKDNSLKVLRIVFNGGTMYQYEDVDVYDYLKFRDADSQGKAFAQYIRKYKCEKLEAPDLKAIEEELVFRSGNGFEIKNTEKGYKIIDASGKEVFNLDKKLDEDTYNIINDVLKAVGVIYKEV